MYTRYSSCKKKKAGWFISIESVLVRLFNISISISISTTYKGTNTLGYNWSQPLNIQKRMVQIAAMLSQLNTSGPARSDLKSRKQSP
jgi:hypothetical protein